MAVAEVVAAEAVEGMGTVVRWTRWRSRQGGSVDVYFGPKAPAGKESNWIQTMPGKGWNTILRLYGPLER